MSQGGTAFAPGRRPALDSLRGLAALVVLIHHSLLTIPALADGYTTEATVVGSSWATAILYSPLHVAWAGREAVFVFFVISGLVLALPAAQGRTMSWRGYYPSRLLRLYVPTVAAVALAWLLVAAVPRHPHAGDSWWLAAHTSPVPLSEAAHDASLLLGSTWLNSALWSLKWEVLFSLLLPLFILLLVRPRRVWPWGLGVLAALVVGQASGHAVLVFMPMFGIGVLLARALPQLDESGRRFDQAVGLHRAAVVVLALVLLVSQWWLRPIVRGTAASTVGLVLTMLGASAIVWLFACTRTVSPVALSRAGQWLGLRSFSLYLVHEPIVVTSGYLLRGTWLADATLVVAVPLSLLAAELFGRLCEVPSHRLAQRVAARLRTADPAGSGLQSSPASTG